MIPMSTLKNSLANLWKKTSLCQKTHLIIAKGVEPLSNLWNQKVANHWKMAT